MAQHSLKKKASGPERFRAPIFYELLNRRHTSRPDYYAYNSRGTSSSRSDALGSMNWLGQSGSQNNNANQYIVTVSVLPEGYTVPGLGTIVIGDPRGGRLTNN